VATLYLTEQGSVLYKTSDRLVVEKHGEVLLEIPCLKLDAILIFGNVQVTTQALVELLDHGIELALLSLSGKLRGQLTPPKARNIPLRMRQYEVAHEEPARVDLAREVVLGKVLNSIAVLKRFRRAGDRVTALCAACGRAHGTPTRLRSRNRLMAEVSFRELVFAMLRRILELAYFHVPEAAVDWSFRPLLEAASRVEVTAADLRWHD